MFFFFSKILFYYFFEFYFIYFLYSRFLLAIYFIHISVYMSIPIFQFIPSPPPPHHHFPPLVSKRLYAQTFNFTICMRALCHSPDVHFIIFNGYLFLLCKRIHQIYVITANDEHWIASNVHHYKKCCN